MAVAVLTFVTGLYGCVKKSNCDYDCAQRVNGSINGHDWVDMGTSVKWSTTNVSSTTPTGNGDYFAWGEINPAPGGDYCESANCLYGDSCIAGIEGDDNYDVARTKWGSTWRLPTRAEWRELINGCDWEWYGSGYKVTAKNGNVLYLPAAGLRSHTWRTDRQVGIDGRYWSASPGHFPTTAWSLYFNSNYEVVRNYRRYLGFSVRPVSE